MYNEELGRQAAARHKLVLLARQSALSRGCSPPTANAAASDVAATLARESAAAIALEAAWSADEDQTIGMTVEEFCGTSASPCMILRSICERLPGKRPSDICARWWALWLRDRLLCPSEEQLAEAAAIVSMPASTQWTGALTRAATPLPCE